MTQTKAELLQTRHQGDIRLGDADSTHYVGFKAPATVSSSLVWTLPAADGTANYLLKTDGSGNLGWVADSTTDSSKMPLTGGIFTGDVTFDGATAGRDIVFDRSDNALEFADNAHATFGGLAGGDLDIYHDSVDTYINNSTGGLYVRSDTLYLSQKTAAEHYLKGIANGAVELYHNNVKTFETQSTGIQITGPEGSAVNLYMYADEGDDNADKWVQEVATDGAYKLRSYSTGSWSTVSTLDGSGNATLAGSVTTGGDLDITVDGPCGIEIKDSGHGEAASTIKIGNGGKDLAISAPEDITHQLTSGHFKVEMGGSEKVRIDSSGRLLLGTTTEGNGGADDLTIANSGSGGITIRSGTSNEGNIFFSDGTSGDDEYRGVVRYDHSNNSFIFKTFAATALTINGSQNATFASAIYGPVKTVSALELNLSTGNYFIKTISGNSTFTFANPAASGTVTAFTLELTHSSGTVTWPSSVKWNADTAPTLTTGKTHLFMFVTDDGGTRYRGSALVDYVN